MPFIVPTTPPVSATSVPFAPEVAAKYTLTGPDGSIATFNDSSDPNWVGNLDDITGLDSADVRESGDILVQSDGGWQGNNWYGRRPITLSGTCFDNSDAAVRAFKLDLIRRASNAMQNDAVLSWQNSAAGSVPMQTWVRRTQAVRFTGGWNKTFQILLISQYAPLFSSAVHSPASQPFTNLGNYPAAPVIRITGPTSDPVITNTTTGAALKFLAGTVISSGHYVDVDVLNHTAVQDGTISVNSQIDFVNTVWPAVISGNNLYSLSEGSGGGITGGTFSLTWRDNWI